MSIPESDKKYLIEKFVGFLNLFQETMCLLERNINMIKASTDKNLKAILPELEHGLNVLKESHDAVKSRGLEGLARNLQRSERGGRPGLGLNRGFGEFLYNFKNRGFNDEWADEIMAAVRKIEHYYNDM